jgi:GNAT superfamily N-acetyltransferase
MQRLTSGIALGSDHAAALEVWRAANAARGLPPDEARAERVRAKLADPAACLVVVREGGAVIAMALAEPFRGHDGTGSVIVGAGHVSMVFVNPDRWGIGVGRRQLECLHEEMRARGWRTASLWTRSNNDRARRLYKSNSYHLTSDTKQLANGDEIVRYETDLRPYP